MFVCRFGEAFVLQFVWRPVGRVFKCRSDNISLIRLDLGRPCVPLSIWRDHLNVSGVQPANLFSRSDDISLIRFGSNRHGVLLLSRRQNSLIRLGSMVD